MKIIEKQTNELEIDNDIICDYFSNLEGEVPNIDDLMCFINSHYYCSDFIDDTYWDYEGDNVELLEMYNEYIKDND